MFMLSNWRKKIPEGLRSLFWSFNFETLDLDKDKRLVIIQVINYGSWSQWRWLVDVYGKETLRAEMLNIPASEFRPGALKLASLLLSLNTPKYASRGSY